MMLLATCFISHQLTQTVTEPVLTLKHLDGDVMFLLYTVSSISAVDISNNWVLIKAFLFPLKDLSHAVLSSEAYYMY
jgi:hypothetical protein